MRFVKAGDVLGGRYRLLHPIGEGGMGAVWRARQIELDADVAIKVLHERTAEHPGAVSRFKREAKASAALRSRHVVHVVDYGVDELTGTAFIAMELLDGESLAARLARERKLGPEETSRWITHAARALTRAHAAGIVHRDLKPANIFIVQNEDEPLAKVLDFGIAKLVGQRSTDTATATGALLGTPHYMSPEQIDPSSVVDFRSDLWSLAVIACECMTGRRPFESDTLASLAMKISLSRSEKPSSLGPVPRGFDAWFARGTEVVPQRRFDSALELATSLRAVVEEGGSISGEPSKIQPTTTRHELTPSLPGLASRATPGTGGDRGRGVPEGGIWARIRANGGALAAGVALVGGAAASWMIARAPAGETASYSLANGGSHAGATALPAPVVVATPLHAPAASVADAGTAAPRSGGSKPTGPSERTSTPSEGAVAPPTPRVHSVLEAAAPRRSRGQQTPGANRTNPSKTRPSKASASKPSASKPSESKPPVDPYDLP